MVYRKYDPDRFTRRSLRISDRDYSSASAYFVTIRAEQREPVFEIPELRKILVETWKALPDRFTGVKLDEFVVMPDHIHFIIWLDGLVENAPTLGSVVGAYKSITTVTWYQHLKAVGTTWPGFLLNAANLSGSPTTITVSPSSIRASCLEPVIGPPAFFKATIIVSSLCVF